MHTLLPGGSSYEQRYDCSRAVVDGDWVFVAGTTGFDYATMTIADDAAEEARQCFRTIADSLGQAGASLADVVRVRYYVVDAADWPAIGAVRGEMLADVRPAATAIFCGLIDPSMRVEIEVTARRSKRAATCANRITTSADHTT